MDFTALMSPILSAIGAHPKARKFFLDPTSIIRLIRLECEHNLTLTACLDLDRNECAQSDPGMIAIARCLENSVVKAVMGHGDLNEKAYSKLSSWTALSDDATTEEDNAQKEKSKKSAAELIRRVYINSQAVKTAASILHENPNLHEATSFRNIKFRVRLKNLRDAYKAIIKNTSQNQ